MPRSGRGWLAVVLAAAGGLLTGLGGAGWVKSTQLAPPKDVAYHETAACSDCPAGIRIESVEVQARQGSTLFIVGGKWPTSVDALHNNVRLLAGKTEVVLKPHGSQNVFEVFTAASNGVPLPASGLAATISGGALLINLSPALAAPLTFEFGLWDGNQYSGRIPRSDVLAWDGKSAPAKPAAAGPAPSQPPSTKPAPTADAASQVTPLAACTSISAAAPVPPYLAFTQLTGSGLAPDPRTKKATRSITAGLRASALDVTSPFAIIAIVSRSGDQPPGGQSRPIDRAGTEQLYLFSDGTTKHKAVRTFRDGAWTAVQDAAADGLTYDLTATKLTFFWTGLNSGDQFGFVSSGGAPACAQSGLEQLQPVAPVP